MSFNPSSLPCILSLFSSRDQNKVLAEDREKLRVLQPLQPWFSQEQREELAEVHPWIQQHTIPQEIDTQVGICNDTHSPQTFIFLLPWTCLTYLCVSQGCVSCNAGVAHSPHPPAPDSSSPLDSPQQDSTGPVVDTWETWKPKQRTTQLTANQPCQKPQQLPPCISSDQSGGVGPYALVWSLICFVKVSEAGPGPEEQRRRERWAFLLSFSLSQPDVTAFIGP